MHHAARARAGGRHRHRRRHRRAREHLSASSTRRATSPSPRPCWRPRRSASPCSRPRSRSSRCSCRSRSWAASSAASSKSFGLTMAFAIGVSLLVSFTLTPMLSARWLKPLDRRHDGHGREEAAARARRRRRSTGPSSASTWRCCAWVMRHRWVVVARVAGDARSRGAARCKTVPKGFLPETTRRSSRCNVRAPEGTSLESTELIGERIAREIRALPGVESTLVTIGDNDVSTRRTSPAST